MDGDASVAKATRVGELSGRPVVSCPPGVSDFPVPQTNTEGPSKAISHVVFVVRENKAFEGVFGDFPGVNGHPENVIAPQPPGQMDRIWMNLRKMARAFALSDNYYTDAFLSNQGHVLFDKNCASCHGKAGRDEHFPNKIVPIESVGTDPVRLKALNPEMRKAYSASWFGEYGKQPFVADPGGYVPPPLDGIWASAPYFHNGSVPTLWHLLHPDERPKVWLRSEDVYDPDFWTGECGRTAVAAAHEAIGEAGWTVTAVVEERPCGRRDLSEDLVPYYDEAEDAGSCLVFVHEGDPEQSEIPDRDPL